MKSQLQVSVFFLNNFFVKVKTEITNMFLVSYVAEYFLNSLLPMITAVTLGLYKTHTVRLIGTGTDTNVLKSHNRE